MPHESETSARRGAPTAAFYDRNYFQGTSRGSIPHTRATILPAAMRTAAFLCRDRRPGSVLDLGCAKGFLLEAFRAHGVPGVTGMDVSVYAIGEAASAVRGRLVVGDVAEGIPLRDDSFDLVTALDLFEHLPDPLPVLAEIRRVLRASGRAYAKICHPAHPNATRDPSHVNVRPLPYWRTAFVRAGFVCERVYEADITGATTPTGWLRRVVRRLRERFVIGTPADYKFVLRRRADG